MLSVSTEHKLLPRLHDLLQFLVAAAKYKENLVSHMFKSKAFYTTRHREGSSGLMVTAMK